MATVLELQRAGFSDDEISLWVNEKKEELSSVGYNNVQLTDYFGIPFHSKSKAMNTSLIGPDTPLDVENPENKKLSVQEKKDKEHLYYDNVDGSTKNRKDQILQVYDESLTKRINEIISKNDTVPYDWDGLQREAFVQRNYHNLEDDTKIYDNAGQPISKDYHDKFTLNENFINKYSGHTYNILQKIYDDTGITKDQYGHTSWVLDNFLKHAAKTLSGNESWGSRSYSWGDGTYGIFRMNADQVQTAINSYRDILTANEQPTPYWLDELANDKDISGITADAQVALFLAYLRKQSSFAEHFQGLLKGDLGSVQNLLIDNFLIPRKIKEDELTKIINRFTSNYQKHFWREDQDKIENTSMQIAAFGKGMPDIISMSGDHLFGEGRKDMWEKGGMNTVTEMGWNMYWDIKEQMEKDGKYKLDVQKFIDQMVNEGQRWDKRGLAGFRNIVEDLWVYGLGTIPYVLTAPFTGVASPYLIGGGAFALHGMLRYSLVETYMTNDADDFKGYWDILVSKTAAKVYGKDFLLGASVVAGGKIAHKTLGSALALTPLADTFIGKQIVKWGSAGGEITALAVMPSIIEYAVGDAIEYLPPTKADFLDAAVIIFTLRAATSSLKTSINKSSPIVKRGIEKLYRIYYQTGKTPKEIIKDIEKDPSILDNLQDDAMDMPLTYRQQIEMLKKKRNEVIGKENENKIDKIPKPKFMNGNLVNVEQKNNLQAGKGKIVEVGMENGKHTYIVEYPNGDRSGRVPEHLLQKWQPKKSPIKVWQDPKVFEEKQKMGEYDSKIEVLERDEQVFETTRQNINEVFNTDKKQKITVAKDGTAFGNEFILWISKYYPQLKLAIDKFTTKRETKSSTQDLMVKRLIPFNINPSKVTFLFKIGKESNLGTKDAVIVAEIDGKMFHFDLQSYMALKKLEGNKNAVVDAHVEEKNTRYSITGKEDNAAAVLLFRTEKMGQLTGMLYSILPNEKVTNEAIKFKNEFGTKDKTFADFDAEPTSGARTAPKWEDMDLESKYGFNKDLNIFKGLNLADLIELFKVLSEGDTPTAKKIRSRRGWKTSGRMIWFEGGKGKIELHKDLFNMEGKDITYKENLEVILMTMAHELGHYIDFIPEKTLSRGNILARLASFKHYLNDWIASKEGGRGPLSDAEIAKMRAEAEKTAKAFRTQTNKEIITNLGIKPEDILKIITDTKAREFLPPALYEAYAKASSELKKSIIKDAMKNIVSRRLIENIKSTLQKYKTGKLSVFEKQHAEQLFKQAMQKEIQNRHLVGRGEIMVELQNLTQTWKEFNVHQAPRGITDKQWKAYVKYRYSSKELMADFMMSLLLRPQETQLIAPIAFRTFFNYMHKKPEVQRKYDEIQTELNLPKDERLAIFERKGVATFRENRYKMAEKIKKVEDVSEVYDLTKRSLDNVFFTIVNYYKKIMGDKHWLLHPKENKRFKQPEQDDVEKALSDLTFIDTHIEYLQNHLWIEVMQPLLNAGINRDVFGFYLKSKWIAKPDGPRSNVLNPKGEERIMAEDIVGAMEKKYPQISEIAESFYRYREKYVIPELERMNVFDAVTMAKIRDNREYVTFVIEEYANWRNDKWVQGFIHATKFGTAKDIMNPFEATILKDWALTTIAQRHFTIGVVARFLFKYKFDIEQELNRKELNWKKGFKINGKIKLLKPITERTIEPAKKVVTGTGDLKTWRWTPKDKGLDHKRFTLIEWTEDGQLKAAYFGREVADGFTSISKAYENMYWTNVIYGLNAPYRKMFTELNPGFWGTNVFRDVMRTLLNLPNTTVFDILHGGKNAFIRQMWNSFKPAYKSIFRRMEELDKDVDKMLSDKLIITLHEKFKSRAAGITEGVSAWNTTDGIVRTIVLLKRKPSWEKLSNKELEATFDKAEKPLKDLTPAEIKLEPYYRDAAITKMESSIQGDRWFGNDSHLGPIYKTIILTEKMARVFERQTKIAAYKHLKKLQAEGIIDWTDSQIGYAIRNWAGSPNFLRKGSKATLYNNLLLFGNAAKEEWRSVIEARRYQSKYIWPFKLFGYAVGPQLMYWAGKAGMLGAAAHLYYNLIGNDTLAKYYVVPLGVIEMSGEGEEIKEYPFGLQTQGEFHVVGSDGWKKMKSGNGQFKAVYFQFPKDEMIKMFGAAVWHGTNELYGTINDDPLNNIVQRIIQGSIPTLDEATPSLSPFIWTLYNLISATGQIKGWKPFDPFTKQNLYPDKFHDQKGWRGLKTRMTAWMKWYSNNGGGLIFHKFDTPYSPYKGFEPILHEIEQTCRIPVAGNAICRFIKISDRGIPESAYKKLVSKRIIENDISATADQVIEKYLDGQKLTENEMDALNQDPDAFIRYWDAVKYHLEGTEGGKILQMIMNIKNPEERAKFIMDLLEVTRQTGFNLVK